METVNDELRKRIEAQQARKQMPPQKKITVTDMQSGLATKGPQDLVMGALNKRDSEVVGYSPKQSNRQMVSGGKFGYAGPDFKASASANASANPFDKLLTLENAPKGMGWQERSALNKQILANIASAGSDATSLAKQGMVNTGALTEREMIEQGLGTRQQAGFGHQTSERIGTESFTAGESAKTRKFTTAERLGGESYKSKQAKSDAITKYSGEAMLAGADPDIMARNIENADMGFMQGPSSRILQTGDFKNRYANVPGQIKQVWTKDGRQVIEYPRGSRDLQTGEFIPDVGPEAEAPQGDQGLIPAGGGTALNVDGEQVIIPDEVADRALTMSPKDAEEHIRKYIKMTKANAAQYK
jgi:hypothetical protein